MRAWHGLKAAQLGCIISGQLPGGPRQTSGCLNAAWSMPGRRRVHCTSASWSARCPPCTTCCHGPPHTAAHLARPPPRSSALRQAHQSKTPDRRCQSDPAAAGWAAAAARAAQGVPPSRRTLPPPSPASEEHASGARGSSRRTLERTVERQISGKPTCMQHRPCCAGDKSALLPVHLPHLSHCCHPSSLCTGQHVKGSLHALQAPQPHKQVHGTHLLRLKVSHYSQHGGAWLLPGGQEGPHVVRGNRSDLEGT